VSYQIALVSIDKRYSTGWRFIAIFVCTTAYVDDILAVVERLNEHARLVIVYRSICFRIVLYTDDILLLLPTVTALQEL